MFSASFLKFFQNSLKEFQIHKTTTTPKTIVKTTLVDIAEEETFGNNKKMMVHWYIQHSAIAANKKLSEIDTNVKLAQIMIYATPVWKSIKTNHFTLIHSNWSTPENITLNKENNIAKNFSKDIAEIMVHWYIQPLAIAAKNKLSEIDTNVKLAQIMICATPVWKSIKTNHSMLTHSNWSTQENIIGNKKDNFANNVAEDNKLNHKQKLKKNRQNLMWTWIPWN